MREECGPVSLPGQNRSYMPVRFRGGESRGGALGLTALLWPGAECPCLSWGIPGRKRRARRVRRRAGRFGDAAPLPPPGQSRLPVRRSRLPASLALDPRCRHDARCGAGPRRHRVEVGRTDLLGGGPSPPPAIRASSSCADDLVRRLPRLHQGLQQRGAAKHLPWNMEAGRCSSSTISALPSRGFTPSAKTQFNGQTEGGGPVSVRAEPSPSCCRKSAEIPRFVPPQRSFTFANYILTCFDVHEERAAVAPLRLALHRRRSAARLLGETGRNSSAAERGDDEDRAGRRLGGIRVRFRIRGFPSAVPSCAQHEQ